MTTESTTDVLVVGAGPAGLMLATWLSKLGVKTRIVDKRGTKIFAGQADGLQCRTLEILDSFGIGDRVWKESNHMLEFCMWNPDPSTDALRRSDRVANTPVGLSRYQECVLHQGRIERFFLDAIKDNSNGHTEVERGVLPEKLEFDRASAGIHEEQVYPIEVTLRYLSEEEAMPKQSGLGVSDGLYRSSLAEDDTQDMLRKSKHAGGETEKVRAKYMVGCDGAHSWTRQQLGKEFELEGEATDYIWGVLDIVPITNFPDIRMRCAIHSASSGSMMVIPREHGMVRLYIQLTEVKPDQTGRADRSQITPASILKAAQKIIHPYELTYEYCDWWTGYQIGQRVGKRFDDHNRIFLAGDAIHTHSPKAGQGMNVSMQDTYNLGWKLALVLNGTCQPHILSTYATERRQIAHDLIAFDHKFSRLFSGRPAKDAMDEAGVSMSEFKKIYLQGQEFASGIAVDYAPSVLVAKEKPEEKQKLAGNVKVGKRFPSALVLNQSDARPWQLQHWMKSDGRFHVMLFAGDVLASKQKARVEKCAQALSKLLERYQRPGNALNSAIQILTVHSSPRQALENGIFDFPEVLRGPRDPKMGWDYNRIFVDEASYHEGGGKAYEAYGVNEESGCMVVCRPDQYVGWIGELEDVEELGEWFEGFMIASQTGGGDANEKEMVVRKGDDDVDDVTGGKTKDLEGMPLDQASGLAV